MKSLRKCLIATLTVLLLLCVAVFAVACNSTQVLTLDLNGGTLSNEGEIKLKEGADVYEAVKDLVPTKDGLVFGAWFVGDDELTPGYKMTEGLTLTAKWKVEYTVKLYLQILEDTDIYICSDSVVTETDYVGSKVTPTAPKVEGFHNVDFANATGEMTLKENKSDNILQFYYDRNEYALIYDANLPAGVDYTDMEETTGLFEAKIAVAAEGFDAPKQYRFVGWSTDPHGEAQYSAGEKVQLKEDTVLYAVWNVGYVDAWGGSDIIFLSDDGSAVTLERLDETYTGAVDADGIFTVGEMKGKLSDGKFAYYREDFKNTFYWLDGYYHAPSEQAELIKKSVKLTLDGYINGVYVGDGEESIDGTYGYDTDAQSYYFVTEYGQRLNFNLGTYEDTSVFAFDGEEAGVYDELISTSAMGGYNGDYTVLLDGYGSAIVGDTSGSETKLYEGTYSLKLSKYSYGNEPVYLIHVYTAQGEFEFFNYPPISDSVVFKDDYAGSYTGQLDGKDVPLTLDGFSLLNGAKLGDEEYNYYVTESEVFGTLLNLFDDKYNEVMTLRFDAEQKTFEQFDTSYVEYLYLRTDENGKAQLYYPLILLYDATSEKGKRAEIYAMDNSDENPKLIFAATCNYETKGNLYGYTYYRLTLKEYAESYTADSLFPVDSEAEFQSISIVFNKDTLTYDVYYILEYNGEPLYETYTEKGGSATIWQGIDTGISGLGSFYIKGNSVIEGRLSVFTGNIANALKNTDITPAYFVYFGDEGTDVMFVALYEDGSFTEMQSEPYQAMLRDEFGTEKNLAGVYFDGLGNGYYFSKNDLTTPDAFGPVSQTDETTSDGTPIWIIEPQNGQPVKFVLYESAQGNFYAYPFYEEKRELTQNDEKLLLDGYNYLARYTDAAGNVFTGEYHIVDPSACDVPEGYKTTYVMQAEGSLLWRFYVKEDGAFDAVLSVLGNMNAGVLMVMDDSYNAVGMMMASLEEGIQPSITYMLMDESDMGMGGAFEVYKVSDECIEVKFEYISLMNDGETVTLILSDFGDSSCTLYNEKLNNVYTDGMAQLTLDGYGYADYVDKYGYVTTGAYVVFDDTHIAYETSEGGSQFVFKLDDGNKTFEELDLSSYYSEYKAEDDSTLTFGKYFFVNGESVGFWYVDGDKGVIMVYDDSDGVYATTEFTPESDTLTYDGKEYTLQH